MDKIKIGFVSLGCDKNRIDTEIMINSVNDKFEIVNDPKIADVIVINTCGFIESAKQESINTIIEMSEYKKKYNCKLIVATGCLTQRYGKELLNLMPEIDILLGVNDYDKLIPSIIYMINSKKRSRIYYNNYSNSNINEGKRILTTKKHTAYLRIAEGCNNYCTYCIIPRIRGNYRSRKIENIIEEAKSLADSGVRELILIAQDTPMYGIDLYGKKKLHLLLKKLSEIDNIKWIRILYCYPEEIYDDLLYEIRDNEKVCKYLDIPIQHVSNNILKKMNRKSSKEKIIESVKKIKSIIPDVVLRTSLIVGFPGENQDDFNELYEFVKEIKFDNLGVFKYSREEGTPAAEMPDQIDEDIKEKREKKLMNLQQNISYELNKNKIGNTYDVIIDNFENGTYSARNYGMSPEIDGTITFKYDKMLDVGSFIKVKIINANEYDLMGVVQNESCK